MSVRMVRPEEFDRWLPLWQGYQVFYEVRIPDEVTQLTWRRFHDETEPVYCAVAEVDGQLVGMVHYIFHRSCWTASDYCYLQDLFTAEPHRGKGIGRQLIEHVYAAAKQRDSSRVYWLTHESNEQAMMLYDRIATRSGFVQYRKALK